MHTSIQPSRLRVPAVSRCEDSIPALVRAEGPRPDAQAPTASLSATTVGAPPGVTAVVAFFLAACLLGSAAPSRAQDSPAAEVSSASEASDESDEMDEMDEGDEDEVNDIVDYRTLFDTSVRGVLVDGHEAAFQQRHQLPAEASGGLESFFMRRDVGKRATFRIEGRGIFDNHDYLLKLELVHPDIGYVRGGYREFRTWYDGSGGFFPATNGWFSLFDEQMHIDRGEAWFETGLTRPNVPRISFHYSHQFRDGQKDSTVWGDAAFAGLPANANTRGIVPSFRDIDERRNILEAHLTHTIGATDFGARARYEFSDQENSLNYHRRPGEPQDRFVTQREGTETDILTTHAYTRTRLHEKVEFSTGYLFTTLDTDLSGSRIYGTGYDPIYDPAYARRQPRDEGFYALEGGSQLKQHVANLNLMLSPFEHLAVVPSVKIQKQEVDGESDFIGTNVGTEPAFVGFQEDVSVLSEREWLEVSERIELRYTGLPKWMFYARGDWLQGDGDLFEQEINPAAGIAIPERKTDSQRFTQQYTAGANWYPVRQANIAAQYYHKVRENDFDHSLDSTSNALTSNNRYPAYLRQQGFTTDDLNVRLTLRPVHAVTLISRYDYQWSTVDTQGDHLATIESAKVHSHIFSQGVSWAPLAQLYLQANVNYTIDRLETPATELALPDAAGHRVLESENDYLNTSLSLGYALSNKTDLEATYFYYLADNYEDNSLQSVAYGAGEREHGVAAGLIRRIRNNVLFGVNYGFFAFRDDTSGDHRNYDAHMLYSSLRMRF